MGRETYQPTERGQATFPEIENISFLFNRAFDDSDDWMKTHYLETLNKVIVEYPEVKLLAAKYSYDKSGKSNSFLQNLAEGWYDQSLFLRGSIIGCNFCIKIKDHSFKLFHGDRVLALTEDWLFLLENLVDNKIFIKDEVCITMRQHTERSIHNNRKVIEASRKGTDWILRNLKFSTDDKKMLIAWSHHFCGVHEYLDYRRIPAMNEAMAALKEVIFQKQFWLLFVKSIVGKKLIKAIR